MDRYRIQLRNVQNVAASKTALIDCPVGPIYDDIILQHGFSAGTNTIAGGCANITQIRVKRNGRVQRTFSGAELRDLLLCNGTDYDMTGLPNTAPGVSFHIHFFEPWRQAPSDQIAAAWNTNGWSSFQIEVDLGAASTPTLVAAAVVRDSTGPDSTGWLTKVIRQQFPAAGTQFDISTIDKRDAIQQITLYPDSGASIPATEVDVRKNGQIIHELSASANLALLQGHNMTPAASGRTVGLYDVVFDHEGLLSSAMALDGARDFTVTIKVPTGPAMSGTVTALIQRAGPAE